VENHHGSSRCPRVARDFDRPDEHLIISSSDNEDR
jgi:hypothetical protein